MIVRFQKKIEFVNNCNCLVEYETLEKAIKWYSDKPVARLKHIFLHGRYPAISIYGDKIHIHRLLTMYFLKSDLEREIYIHHIDGNPLNNMGVNLEVMTSSYHQSITNKGRKQNPDWVKKRITKTANAKRGKKYPKKIFENKELLDL